MFSTLTYSTFEVVPVSKFLCPKSIVLFISMICHLDWIQSTIVIIFIPQNHLDKLWFTFSEEVIIKCQLFFIKKVQKIQHSNFKIDMLLSLSRYHIITKTCHKYPAWYCFKKRNIIKINVWNQEDQIFILHPNWTIVTTFWCRDQDKVLSKVS